MTDPKNKKFNDPQIAKKVWPIYLACGSARDTLEQLKKDGVDINRQTLNKLIDHFGFVEEREKHIKAQVELNVKGGADSEASLESLLIEVTEQKTVLYEIVSTNPLNLKAQKLYGESIGQILGIKKLILAAKQVNKDALLADAFSTVVKVLLEIGQQEAAEVVTQNLENFTARIEEKWRKQN